MPFKHLRNKSGTSLAEVLVVTIILVTGILIVLRVFPVGFNSLQHGENVSIAGRLAQQELEKWHNRASNLPEGILPIVYNPATGQNDLALDLVPGPPFDLASASGKNSEAFRRVVGEVTKIPVGTYFDIPGNVNVGAMYVLGFSPIHVWWPSGTPGDGQPGNLVIYGGNMRGRAYDSTDAEPWFRLGSRYGIDYDAGKICFARVGQDRVYKISYSYWIGSSNQLNHVIDDTITVPANTEAWLAIPSLPSGAKVDQGSERVARAFQHLSATDVWSTDDPYQYKLVDPVVGIIAFNPEGYGYHESTQLGVKMLEAHLNYEILSLQIISEERTLPTSGPFKVKLTLPFIKKKAQTVETDGAIYQGIGQGMATVNFGGVAVCPDMLVVNPADGAKLLPRDDDPLLPGDFVLDDSGFKTGSVKFDSEFVRAVMPSGTLVSNYSIAGKTLRFYYQADNDWSVQLHKAYELYVDGGYTTSGIDIDYKQYLRDASVAAGDECRLLFKPCDAKKTVAVTYKWEDDNGILRTEIGETVQISETVAGGFCFAELRATESQVREITTVAGVSVKARTLWRERNQWMYSDMESSLMRRPTEL